VMASQGSSSGKVTKNKLDKCPLSLSSSYTMERTRPDMDLFETSDLDSESETIYSPTKRGEKHNEVL
jgi:hypothetical protein